MTLPEILTHFPGAEQDRDNHWMARCPAHEQNGSHRPSLSISLNGSKVLVKCFAGCRQDAIAAAAGLKLADLFTDEPPKKSKKQPVRLVGQYDYRDAAGQLVYQVVRFEPKDFRQRRPNPDKPGDWIWNMDGVDRVLYRLPDVLDAVAEGRPVWLVEGEKDADLLARLGLCATTSPGGAGKWKDDYAEWLQNARVVIVPDRDAVGLAHGRQVHASVGPLALETRWLELPGGKDASEWAASTGLEQEEELRAHFEALAASAPTAPPLEDKPPAPPAPAPLIEVHDAPADDFQLTDLGNARRLVARHGHGLRYCRTHARWYAWDGRRWSGQDGFDLVMQRAKETADQLMRDAADESDKGRKKALAVHALHTQAAARLDAMVRLAETEPGVPVKPEEFDRDPMLLNVANGVLDLATGELRPHDPALMMTRLAPVDFDPAAPCPRFLQYLERVVPDAEERYFLQRSSGYSLSGDVGARVMFFLWGKGHNGKSTYLDIMARLLGDYAHRVPVEVIMDRKGDAIPNDLAMLAGLRLAYTSETKAQKRLDEGRVKDITSGAEPMTARFLRAEYFEFRPVCKFFLATNHKPVIKETDSGIWGRIRLLPFIETIPEGERIEGLAKMIFDDEAGGILNWALQGCLAWKREGLAAPEVVKQALSEYRQESDPLADFLYECTIQDDTVSDTSKALFLRYEEWAKANGEKHSISRTAFGLAIGERGFRKERTRTGIVWHGLRTASYSEISTHLSDSEPKPFTVNGCEPTSGKVLRDISLRGTNREMGSQLFTDQNYSPDTQKQAELLLKSYDTHVDNCSDCHVDENGADLCAEGRKIFDDYLKSIGEEKPHE